MDTDNLKIFSSCQVFSSTAYRWERVFWNFVCFSGLSVFNSVLQALDCYSVNVPIKAVCYPLTLVAFPLPANCFICPCCFRPLINKGFSVKGSEVEHDKESGNQKSKYFCNYTVAWSSSSQINYVAWIAQNSEDRALVLICLWSYVLQ